MAGEATSARETIARLTVELGADGSRLPAEMAGALAKAHSKLESANKRMERSHAATTRAIQSKIDSINATRATSEMRLLEQAVQRMGGTANMNAGQVARLRQEVTALAAAGARLPQSLRGLQQGQLSRVFTGLSTGGVTGALSAIGPAGLAAAAGIGAATAAAARAASSFTDLASQAERWTNLSKSTGIGVTGIQQLSDYLNDAGVDSRILESAMRELHKEIATGGRGLQRFGIEVESLKGLSPEEQFRQMAAQIAAIEDPETRAAVAMAAFTERGVDLIPVLDGIGAGAYKAFEALGEGSVESLTEADKVLDEFNRKWTTIKKGFLAGAAEIALSIADPHLRAWGAVLGDNKGGGQSPEAQEGARRREADRQRRQRQFEARQAAAESQRERERSQRELDRSTQQRHREELARIREETQGEQRAQLAGMAESMEMQVRLREAEHERLETQGRYTQGLDRQNQGWVQMARAMRANGRSTEDIEAVMREIGMDAEEAARFVSQWAPEFEDIAAEGARAGMSVDQIRRRLEAAGASAEQIRRALASIGVETRDWGRAISDCGETISGFGGIWSVIGETIVAITNGVEAIGMGTDRAADRAQRLRAAYAAAAAALSAAGEALGGFETKAGGALSGAAMGMQAGSSFGGWGTLIGGILGAGAGLGYGSKNEADNEMTAFLSNWDRLVAYVRSNPLFQGDEFDPLISSLTETQQALQDLLDTARAEKEEYDRSRDVGKPQGAEGWFSRLGGVSGFNDWRGLLRTSVFGSFGPWASQMRSVFGRSEADIAGDRLRDSNLFNWDAMFIQAQEWGLDLRAAYEEGGEALNEALTQYLDLADRQQALIEQEAELQAQKRRDLEEGLTAAAEGARTMMEALEQGNFSEAATRAAQELIAKVRNALLAAGMGYQLDKRLEQSQAYQGAQGLATGAAQLMAGSRQAGIVDQGMLAAGGVVATEARQAAYEAALAAGMSEQEAQRAGLGAVSKLLQEQLNASIASGQALDSNTQQLLDEARENGINIVADPLIQQLEIQRQMLDQLGLISGATSKMAGEKGKGDEGGEEPGPGEQPPSKSKGGAPTHQAAAGIFTTVRTPNLGGGLSWTVQTHPDEQMVILPRGIAPRGAVVIPREMLATNMVRAAAAGIYGDQPGGLPSEGAGGSTGTPESAGGSTGTPESAGGTPKAAPEVVVTAPLTVVQNINEDPFKSAESRTEARKLTLDWANEALKSGSHPLATTISRKVDEKVRAALAAKR